ncbi:MAG: hypothetical protein J1F07_02275 [Muribaculaceae bacterium]|nr:hypothetical protein [Muribaculaceae bacterium]
MKKLVNKALLAVLALGACAALPFHAYANLNGQWVSHPAANLRSLQKEGQVDRIIEGERYVYFSLRGDSFHRGSRYLYSTDKAIDPLQLFRYDKTLPWSADNLRAVAADLPLSGAVHDVLAYSPERGLLVVVYENRKFDLISDDGGFVASSTLADISVSGKSNRIYSITFDESLPQMYMAGSFGYAVVSTDTGDLLDLVRLDKPVAWAGRVGDNMVVFAGDFSSAAYNVSAYSFPAANPPAVLENPIPDSANIQALMPLTESSFAAMAPGTTDKDGILKLFVREDGAWRSYLLTATLSVDDQAMPNFRHMFRTDGFVSPASGGYAVYDRDGVHMLKKGVDFKAAGSLANYQAAALSHISKMSLTDTAEKASKGATFDGSRLWFYTYSSNGQDALPRGFYTKGVNGGSLSSVSSAVAAPSAPTSLFTVYMDYSPEKGMIARGPGSNFYTGTPDYDYVSAYSAGRWTDLSYGANNSKYVVPTAAGGIVAVDPLNPSWIWGVGCKRGVYRIDTSDYSNFLALGSTQYPAYETNYPGYFCVFPKQVEYNDLINFSQIDFDNDGRMWFARYWLNPERGGDYEYLCDASVPFYYITADERGNMAKIGSDKSKLPPLHELRVPMAESYHQADLAALKHPANQTIVAFTPKFYSNFYQPVILYDHKGQPENPDVHTHAFIEELFDQNGERFTLDVRKGFYEDPLTGWLWLLSSHGVVVVDPQEILAGKRVGRRLSVEKTNGIASGEFPFEHITVNGVSHDNLGRKWVATEEGLYCLSADCKELLGLYTVANSPIPSDELWNVTCDPATGAVFVQSSRGIVEFQPEGSTAERPAGTHLNIWPSAVTPEYRGYVKLTGAQDGVEYVVEDAEGRKVGSLGKASGGLLQWDASGADGSRLAPGRYNVRRDGRQESNPIIIL